jgi:hypothetical protein
MFSFHPPKDSAHDAVSSSRNGSVLPLMVKGFPKPFKDPALLILTRATSSLPRQSQSSMPESSNASANTAFAFGSSRVGNPGSSANTSQKGMEAARGASTPKIMDLKVPELQKMLKDRGLSTKGLRADLIERLKAAIESSGQQVDAVLQNSLRPGAKAEHHAHAAFSSLRSQLLLCFCLLRESSRP